MELQGALYFSLSFQECLLTRGRGVSIHCSSCMRAFDLDPARKVDVAWIMDEQKQLL